MSTRRPDHAKLSRLWLPALLGLNLLLLVFYLAVDYQLSYHSDSAVKNLLAQEIAETGRYFPPDWNYANADLWVLNTHTWIVPLLRWFPNGFPLHVLSDLLTAALTLLAAWAVCRVMGLSRAATLLGLAVLSAGMSPILAEHIFGQGAYGTMFYMVGFLLYAYWAQRRAAGRARWLWAAAAALLLLLVFWGSPSRGMAGYALPLLAALLALRWHERAGARQAGAAAPPPRYAGAVLAVLGAAGGVLLHLYTLRHVHNDPAAPLLWLSPADMGRNVLGVLEGLLSLFDGLPTTGAKVLGAFSAYQALRLLAALALLYLLPWALWRGLRHASGGMLFVLVFSAASTGLNLFVTATTTLADMHSPEASARYLVPSLILLLLGLAGVVLDRRGLGLAPRLAGGAVLLLLAGSAPTTYLRPLSENLDLPWRGARLVTRDTRMIDFLAGQGLQYGYATFWNAGKLSVLSGQRVRVRQIVVERGLPQPMRKLGSNRWYNAAAWQGPTFLLLSADELAALDLQRLGRLAGAPRRLEFEGAQILVFAGNLAAALPQWDTELRRPAAYPVDAGTPHAVGTLQGTPPALVAEPGQSGVLAFGPFRALDEGSFEVSFELEAAGAGVDDFGLVDVAVDGGRSIAQRAITRAGAQRLTLAFSSERKLNAVEFRAISSGKGRLTMRGAEIRRAPAP